MLPLIATDPAALTGGGLVLFTVPSRQHGAHPDGAAVELRIAIPQHGPGLGWSRRYANLNNVIASGLIERGGGTYLANGDNCRMQVRR